ncbi:hypothetical protein C8J56DRAFT_886205 [Mycena floridula]|nr:hypothetical protein C8J56DRAFT_886205 [Mycena floridula]
MPPRRNKFALVRVDDHSDNEPSSSQFVPPPPLKKRMKYTARHADEEDIDMDITIPHGQSIGFSSTTCILSIVDPACTNDSWAPADSYYEETARECHVSDVKKKNSPASDNPLREWIGWTMSEGICRPGFHAEFLYEFIHLEGHLKQPKCPQCNVEGHRKNPLHIINMSTTFVFLAGTRTDIIQEWNGSFFKKTSLSALGLCVQLGHNLEECVNPVPGHMHFSVLHINGIHHVNVDFCDCEFQVSKRQQLLRAEWYPATIDHPKTAVTFCMLEKVHLLNLSGKVSTYEYYKCLQHLTDNTETEIPKYRHLKLMKCAGCRNIPDGVTNIGLEELALRCWVCPNPGVNIVPNWKEVTPMEQWYLFMVVLAMDANFRLKNLNVSNDISDPGLHTRNAYFVPNKESSDHYKKFVSQKDVHQQLFFQHCY